jgi:hypothetical protein
MSEIFVCYIFTIKKWDEEGNVSYRVEKILLMHKIIFHPPLLEFEIVLYLNFGKWWNVEFQTKQITLLREFQSSKMNGSKHPLGELYNIDT